MMVISPDEGGMGRAIYIANVLGLDMGMFYKRRDYSRIVNGRNPIVAHEFLGTSVEGKDMIIIDDMISSGESMLEVAAALKERKANNIRNAARFSTLVRCATIPMSQSVRGIHKRSKQYDRNASLFRTLWYRRLLTALLILIPSRGYWFLKAFHNAEFPEYAVPCRRCLSEDVDIFYEKC